MSNSKSEKFKYKANLYNLLCLVEDQQKQKQVLDLLSRYEAKIPDPKLKNEIQKLFRKNKTYEELCESYVEDMLEGKLNDSTKLVISQLLVELRNLIENEPKNWWDKFIGWFKNSTGTN